MLLTRIGLDAFDTDKPLFVCHGTEDTRIDIAHTRQRIEKRRGRYGQPFEHSEYEGASHSFKPANVHWPVLARELRSWYGKSFTS